MFTEIKSKDNPLPSHSQPFSENLTGENLLQALKNGQVQLSRKTLGGQQSTLIQITWNTKKFLIIVQKKPNIRSCPEALELAKILSKPEFQHDSVIKFIPMKKETGKLLIQQLRKMANTKDFIFSPLHKSLEDWYRCYLEFQKEKGNEEVDIELDCMETINICEVAAGETLEKTLGEEKKHSIAELKLENDYLINLVNCYQSIVEPVIHINSFGAHGDISAVNILVDDKQHCTLIDIGCIIKADKKGLASHISERDLAAPIYLSPELTAATNNKSIVVHKIDSWGLAIILVQLLTKIFPLNIFDLVNGFKEDPAFYLKEKFKACLEKNESPLDNNLIAALPDSEVGKKIKLLLTKALQIDPDNRLSVAEFILYLNYTPKKLDEIIKKNLLLSMHCSNISMVKEFWRILQTEKNLLMSEEDLILEIVDALETCKNIDIIAFILQALINFESFYVVLSKKTTAEIKKYFYKLINYFYYLECARFPDQIQLKKEIIQFIEKMSGLVVEFKELTNFSIIDDIFSLQVSSHLKEYKYTDFRIHQRALEFAIAADNSLFLKKLPRLIKPENIIKFTWSAVKNSNISLKILIKQGFEIFKKRNQSFIHFIVENDPCLLKHILPYIFNLLPKHINKRNKLGNTLLHLSLMNFSEPALFIYFVLLGGDIEITNSEKLECSAYLDNSLDRDSKEDSVTKLSHYQIIMQFLFLLKNRVNLSSSFMLSLFSKTKIDDKELSIIPPTNYSVFKNSLSKYLRNVIITELNLGNTSGDRPTLKNVLYNTDFYKISEIILITLQALAMLDLHDDTQTDTVKCLSCLEFIDSFHKQFPTSPFISKISNIYSKLIDVRTIAVCKKEAQVVSQSLSTSILKKDGETVRDVLKTAHCFFPNPLLLRNNSYECAPLDYIVRAINQNEQWCLDCGIEPLLKKAVGLEDETNIFNWFKFTRIECQIIYALARKQGGQTSAERGSIDRLIEYLSLNSITCNKHLTAMCLDVDQGFYLSTIEDEKKKIIELIKPGMEKWKKIGRYLMDYFNKSFGIKNLIQEYKIKENSQLNNLITHLRDCVYDALVMDGENYLKNFSELIITIPIPEEFNYVSDHLQIFLGDLSQSKHLIKEEYLREPLKLIP